MPKMLIAKQLLDKVRNTDLYVQMSRDEDILLETRILKGRVVVIINDEVVSVSVYEAFKKICLREGLKANLWLDTEGTDRLFQERFEAKQQRLRERESHHTVKIPKKEQLEAKQQRLRERKSHHTVKIPKKDKTDGCGCH